MWRSLSVSLVVPNSCQLVQPHLQRSMSDVSAVAVWGAGVTISGDVPAPRRLQRSSGKRRSSCASSTAPKRRRTARARTPKPKRLTYSEWLATLHSDTFDDLHGAALSAFDQQLGAVKALHDECGKRGVVPAMIVSHNKKKARGRMKFRDDVPLGIRRVFVGQKYAFNTRIEPHPASQSAWEAATAPSRKRCVKTVPPPT